MGAAEEFSALYGEHHTAVLRYVYRRAGADSADDLAAEVFVVAWRRWSQLPAEPLPWLYEVARKVVANHVRGRERSEQLAVRWETEGILPVRDIAEHVAARDSVHAAWTRLGERDREVLALIAWEGLGVRQAAQVLGCSPATFSVQLFRARRRLRAALADSAPFDADPVNPIAMEVGRASG
ncbi:RNA polymerase sigma factor [Kitasatospora phosalacinea]|uniref:RNA polymerase sigma factor n=1 Tax=Kitasatospora phosalacinea TaxID=2065 RepID=UPI000525D30F|nr:sigma-70 family RNA polymerase sigma factor [Kitasatospora phosalacinea]